LLALSALASLSAAGVQPTAPVAFVAELCGSHGAITIPFDGSPPARHHDCPAGCHAVCGRRTLEGDEDRAGE
jgi:hypothetical protein